MQSTQCFDLPFCVQSLPLNAEVTAEESSLGRFNEELPKSPSSAGLGGSTIALNCLINPSTSGIGPVWAGSRGRNSLNTGGTPEKCPGPSSPSPRSRFHLLCPASRNAAIFSASCLAISSRKYLPLLLCCKNRSAGGREKDPDGSYRSPNS